MRKLLYALTALSFQVFSGPGTGGDSERAFGSSDASGQISFDGLVALIFLVILVIGALVYKRKQK